MRPFTFVFADSVQHSVAEREPKPDAALIAGGTCIIDLMKLDVMQPDHLISIKKTLDSKISDEGKYLRIHAGATNSSVAQNAQVQQSFPVLAQALLSGASPQIRNAASIGGNIMQRTRCLYYRDTALPCNKREPQSGCAAIEGYNRGLAILGGSSECIATNTSDMCVALAMLDAVLHLSDGKTERVLPFIDFHVIPGVTPSVETVLKANEVIVAVDVPYSATAKQSHYLKVRDRASFSFALTSAAVGLHVNLGVISSARLALGGVATKPWRAKEAEESLVGKPANSKSFRDAAELALIGSIPRKYNGFKVELAKRTIVRAYEELLNG